MPERYELGPHRTQGLVDVLDRVLDKGLMIAGDIRIRLADVELLTIQIRLLVCSVDKAEAIGMDWWKSDPRFTSGGRDLAEISRKLDDLSARLQTLETKKVGKGKAK